MVVTLAPVYQGLEFIVNSVALAGFITASSIFAYIGSHSLTSCFQLPVHQAAGISLFLCLVAVL